jgi:hypothetical protein
MGGYSRISLSTRAIKSSISCRVAFRLRFSAGRLGENRSCFGDS